MKPAFGHLNVTINEDAEMLMEDYEARVTVDETLVTFKILGKTERTTSVGGKVEENTEKLDVEFTSRIVNKHKQLVMHFDEDTNKLEIQFEKIPIELDGQVVWEKPPNPEKLTWNYQKKYIEEEKNGRLMTIKEIRTFIRDHHDNKPVYEGDVWVACVGEDGKRDWVQIGTEHSLGKGHNENWGYPGWGDDVRDIAYRNKIIFMTCKDKEERKKFYKENLTEKIDE